MTVWIVTKGWCPNTEPSTLETWDGFQEIVGVYSSEANARFVAESEFDPYDQNTTVLSLEIATRN